MIVQTQQTDLLATQLARTDATWAVLRAHGVTEDVELRLDFDFFAPDTARAEQLAAYLSEVTDYDLSTKSEGRRLLRRGSSMIVGTTGLTTVSPRLLAAWVEWMVASGLDYGCEFDGWGAQIPERV